MATKINAYLSFGGNCREAMTFYKDCLGGELSIQTVGESPMAAQMPPDMKDAVLHAALTSGDLVIMSSDLHREKLVDGNTVQLCVNCSSEGETKSFFSKLSAGGKITEPLAEMFWGALYGAFTDKFGKLWLLNCEKKS